MPLSHLIALMIHTRSLKLARSNQTTHAIKQAHAALHTDYSAVVRMIRTSKTMVADASQHPHLMLQRARSIPQGVAKHPQRRWPASHRDLPVRVIILFTMSNNPKRQGQSSQYATNTSPTGKLLLFNGHFFDSLNRRRGPPSAWLSAECSAARSRACEAAPRFMRASIAGADLRPLGFPRNGPRRAVALARLRLVSCEPQSPARTSVRLAFRGMLRGAQSRLRGCASVHASLNRRRGPPSAWLSAEWSAARSRACEAAPRFMRASIAGADVRPPGFPRRPFGLAALAR